MGSDGFAGYAAYDGVVLVTGPPGAGKTTLGLALADRLRLPYLGKDTIKEALFDALGVGDIAWSKRLGGASIEVLFALLPELRAAVVECNFHPDHRARLAEVVSDPVEVFCRVPADVAVRRYRERHRHDGHRDTDRVGEIAGWVTAAEPLAIGRVLELDTSAPVDVDAVADWVTSSEE